MNPFASLPFTTLSRRRRARFYSALGHVLDAGIPLLRAMDVFIDQNALALEKKIAAGMKTHIQEGGSITTALELYPEQFPKSEVNMIASAEFTGVTPLVLERLSKFMAGFSNSLVKMYTGFIYPAMLLFVGYVFIPLFRSIFLGGTEDVLWQILQNIINLAIFVFICVLAWKTLRQLPGFVYLFHVFVLKLPAVGKTVLQISRSRFARMLECMVSSGVPVIESVKQSALGCGNEVMAKKLLKAIPALQNGEPITAAMWRTNALPPVALGMIEVADHTGNLEGPLGKYAEYEELEAERRIEVMARLIPFFGYFLVIILLISTMVFPLFMQYIRLIQIQ